MSMQRSVQALPPEKATCMRRHGAAYGRQRLTQTDRLTDGQTDEMRPDETRREERGKEGKRWRGAVYMSRDRQSILWPETATKTTPTRTSTMLRAEAASLNSFKAATKIFWHGPREAKSNWAKLSRGRQRRVASAASHDFGFGCPACNVCAAWRSTAHLQLPHFIEPSTWLWAKAAKAAKAAETAK